MLLIKHLILTLLMSKRRGGEVCGDIDLQARSSCPRSLLSRPLLPPVPPNSTTVSKASYQPQDHRVLGNTAPSGGFLYHSFLLSLPCKMALQTLFFVLHLVAIFLRLQFFKVVLGSQQCGEEGTEISHIAPAPNAHSLPHYQGLTPEKDSGYHQ